MITLQIKNLNSLSTILNELHCNSHFIQEFYNKLIATFNFYQYRCLCGSSDWYRNGHYSRSLIICETKYEISIQRIRCRHCGSTHAILPSFITPHIQYSSYDIIDILLDYNKSLPLIIHSHLSIVKTFQIAFSSLLSSIESPFDFFTLAFSSMYSFFSTSIRHRHLLFPPT